MAAIIPIEVLEDILFGSEETAILDKTIDTSVTRQ